VSYYLYIIRSLKNNSLYKGISSDWELRLRQHNNGKNQSTKSYRPYKIVYLEKCASRQAARQREKYFKSGVGREKLKKLTNKTFPL